MLFELPEISHVDATSVEESAFWLHTCGGKAAVIAGGTDLLALMKDGIRGPKLNLPEVLINVKTVPEMHRITWDETDGLFIGAAVTLSQIQRSDIVTQHFPILAQAAGEVGSTQIRNMGTIGGNVCQRPRCAYFRHPHFVCFKKGGARCYATGGDHRYYHAIFQTGRCIMAHPSDMAPVLVALEARAFVVGPQGTREILLQDFFVDGNNLQETILRADELLTHIVIPSRMRGTHQVFMKQRIRKAVDFALASVALVARMSEGRFEQISLVLGGVAPHPYVVSAAQEIVRGRSPEGQLMSDIAEASVRDARPLPMNRYKVDLTKAVVRDALTSIGRTHGEK